jgi:hypothetical protein
MFYSAVWPAVPNHDIIPSIAVRIVESPATSVSQNATFSPA